MKLSLFLSTTAILFTSAAARTFTVSNSCSYTVWPAIFTEPSANSPLPSQATGWQALPGTKVSFSVPDNWAGGRIWGRRNCDFSSGNAGPNSCIDGGCNGGLLCDKNNGTAAAPVTVAEFSLSINGQDYTDVSLVDGFNIPIKIDNNQGCKISSCPVDLNAICPTALKGPFDSSGAAVGCKSACVANLDGNPANSPNCCTGSHLTPATCPASGVAYYSFFKNNCPSSIVFPYDDANVSTIVDCLSSKKADYTITFCPPK